MAHVGLGDQNSLLPRQSNGSTDIKKALDFFIDTADGLDFTPSVNRAGNGDILAQRNIREPRRQGVALGRRRAVSFDPP
jgi:hypothetical protein